MAKILMTIGLGIFLFGALWFGAEKLGFKGLPGDISIKTENMTVHFPIVTCILISIVISGLSWLFKR